MARLAPVPVVTPPARWVWGYRLLGLRVPPQYRGWVAREIARAASCAVRWGSGPCWLPPATGHFRLDNDTSLLLNAVVLVAFLGVYVVLVGAAEG